MLLTVRPYAPADEPALLALLRAPGVREEFERYDSPQGVALLLGDPYIPEAGVRLAFADGEPAGFAFAILVPGEPAWAAVRGGVLPDFRRRGVGRALHESLRAYVRAQAVVPGVRELTAAAWQPSPSADALMASLGYRPERWFWMMTRPRGASAPEPAWPEGFEGRVFDGSDEALAEWNAAYNDSFAAHFRFVPSDLERLRKQVQKPGFRADGVLLARLHGRPAGFCRCELHGERGEVAVIGTTRDARGKGLGRALLRWGVGWLERACTGAVTLVVDGENEGALRLYRSEGFEVTRTRRLWERALDPA